LIWGRTTQKYGKSVGEEKHTKLAFDLGKNNRKIRACTCGGRRYENSVFPKPHSSLFLSLFCCARA